MLALPLQSGRRADAPSPPCRLRKAAPAPPTSGPRCQSVAGGSRRSRCCRSRRRRSRRGGRGGGSNRSTTVGTGSIAPLARKIAFLVAILLEVGLVPATAGEAERGCGHLSTQPRLAACGAVGRIRVGQLLQAVKGMATGAAGKGIDRHERILPGRIFGAIDAVEYGVCLPDFKQRRRITGKPWQRLGTGHPGPDCFGSDESHPLSSQP